MNLSDYQRSAEQTAQLDIKTPTGRIELVMGLVSEVGGLARVYKRRIRDDISLEAQGEQIVESLGDVLWYVSMVARSVDLDLGYVAERNLVRTQDRYAKVADPGRDASVPISSFDEGYPLEQRFPRRMVFRLEETTDDDGMRHVSFAPVYASPNPFPQGRYKPEGAKKEVGFTLGRNIGDVVNDNSGQEDGYRYHDAVHAAFMAVLGWSPVLRGLLRLKRKSNEEVDRVQDGARARDLEEALSAILAEMSHNRNNFMSPHDIDGEVRDVIRRVISGLEVASVPVWQWSDAIYQGYKVMNQLRENRGGYIVADLDNREIVFHRDDPIPSMSSNNAS